MNFELSSDWFYSSILTIILLIFLVIIYIAALIKGGGFTGKVVNVINRVRGKYDASDAEEEVEETEEEKRKRIEAQIDFDNKWKKKDKIVSKIGDLGNKTQSNSATVNKSVEMLKKT